MLNKILKILLILDLVGVNIALGYVIYTSKVSTTPFISSPKSSDLQLGGENRVVYKDECGLECQKYISDKVTELQSNRVGVTSVPTEKAVVKTPTKTKTRTVSYVTVPGSGSTLANSWTDLIGTDFYFNKADYPGLIEIYFEVNMSLFNGNGMAYVQLFDVTHGVGVQGSDVKTNSQTNTLVTSGKVTFWAGKNLVRVQAKSLTADTAIYTSGRLRIVTEN